MANLKISDKLNKIFEQIAAEQAVEQVYDMYDIDSLNLTDNLLNGLYLKDCDNYVLASTEFDSLYDFIMAAENGYADRQASNMLGGDYGLGFIKNEKGKFVQAMPSSDFIEGDRIGHLELYSIAYTAKQVFEEITPFIIEPIQNGVFQEDELLDLLLHRRGSKYFNNLTEEQTKIWNNLDSIIKKTIHNKCYEQLLGIDMNSSFIWEIDEDEVATLIYSPNKQHGDLDLLYALSNDNVTLKYNDTDDITKSDLIEINSDYEDCIEATFDSYCFPLADGFHAVLEKIKNEGLSLKEELGVSVENENKTKLKI